MAELGQTLDALELVPGDVAAIEANVLAVRGRGEALASAGDGLNRIDSGAWVGAAGDAFRDEFGYEPRRWFTAADAFETAAGKLADYAGTLRWAQERAGEAIRAWEQAAGATDAARAVHEQETRANLPRGFPPVTVVPFTDPGAAQREQAVYLLARAQEELAAAGAGAAAAIRDAAEEAPKESRWDKFFGGLGDAAGFVGNVGLGLWDGLAGTAEFLWELSAWNLIENPDHYNEMWDGLKDAANFAWEHPVDFAKEMVNWDLWATNPGRALGNTLFGFIPFVGVAAKLRKFRKLSDLKTSRLPEGFVPSAWARGGEVPAIWSCW